LVDVPGEVSAEEQLSRSGMDGALRRPRRVQRRNRRCDSHVLELSRSAR
jgi:hypothetical protein